MAEMNIDVSKKPTINISNPKTNDGIQIISPGTRNHNQLHNLDYDNSGHTGFQRELTFDDTPTADSLNPVTSGGIKTYVDNKIAESGGGSTITVDSALSDTSTNPVQNKVIKNVLDTKQDTLTFDDTPTVDSDNPVTSGGVKIELDLKAEQVELERLHYYGNKNVIPSDESYFTVNGTGETITGLTDTGKTQTELVIPYKINGKEITRIGDVFNGYTSLTSVTFPNSVTSIESYAFVNCISLTSINIPTGVISIGIETFSGCTSLTSINIPNSVTSIGNYAFLQCASLTSINIPNSITSIGYNAFDSCINLTIYCEQGSYAETYAKENNIPVGSAEKVV